MDLVNSELAAIANWFRANKLSLNVSKTNFIVFHSHRKSIPNQRLVISIDNKAILQVKSAKFLGVYDAVDAQKIILQSDQYSLTDTLSPLSTPIQKHCQSEALN